jgi:hypothetical protein
LPIELSRKKLKCWQANETKIKPLAIKDKCVRCRQKVGFKHSFIRLKFASFVLGKTVKSVGGSSLQKAVKKLLAAADCDCQLIELVARAGI